MIRKTWKKHLSVDRQIVRLLSARTYEHFPGAIREMVSNAYDADATEVDIRIDLEGDAITVTDNGSGMTPDDFDFFLRVAGQQRGKRLSPEYRRRRIGQFGIGFLATFPFGRSIKVTSTARSSDIQFEAAIPSQQFMRDGQYVIDVGKIPIHGLEIRDPSYISEHGTTIHISGLTHMFHRYFQGRDIEIRSSRKTITIAAWPPMTQLEWILREDLSIDYPPDSLYEEAFRDLGSSGMTVRLNGNELFRNVHGSDILENESWKYNGIVCRYIIATGWKSVAPGEARGLKRRIRNVGVGGREAFGLGIAGRTWSRLHWLTGEIHVLSGMDDSLTIDRARFTQSPEYDQFSEFFRGRLAYYARFVEDVSEAKRDINRQLRDSRAAEVGSRRTVIDRKIDTLETKGFHVVTKPKSQVRPETPPVKVDVERKVVEVVKDHPDFLDTISVGDTQFPVRYAGWETANEYPPVRWGDDRAIEINTNYPLFKSRRYGEVFKKVLVVMLVVAENVKSSTELISKVARQLEEEFQDLT